MDEKKESEEIKKIKIDVSMFKPYSDEFVEKYEREIEEERKRTEERRKLNYYRSLSSGVPPLFYNESFDTYIPQDENDKKKLDFIKKFSKALNTNKVLLMTGNMGNGKSHLGAAIVRETSGIMATTEDIVMDYTNGRSHIVSELSFLQLSKYTYCKMLVIDEFGRAFNSRKEAEITSYIICKRYGNLLPTCIISNLSKEEVAKRLGGAALDRLNETCTEISFTKKSYRDKLREDSNDIKTRL